MCLVYLRKQLKIISINLWLEYAQFSMGVLESDEVRIIINKGLSVGGLHVSEGSLLWDVLREFEITHLSLMEVGTEEWQKQLQTVQEVFRRQLSVPLLDMEGTYREWKFWLEQLPENHGLDVKQVEWAYQNALKKLEKYTPFEERILELNDDTEILNCYREYIKASNDPSMCLCLYERAVAKLSLNTELWSEYCYYCMKLGEICNKVVKRALRNCPWSEELWICLLRILEDQKKEQKEVTESLEQGLTSISPTPGLNLWLAYLEYFKRNSESTEHLHKLFSQAFHQLGDINDPSFILHRWEARLYVKEGNFEGARKIWSDILKNPNFRKSASAWLEYAALERQSKEPQTLRMIFQRAISVPLDWPQYIVDEWTLFEREFGTLQDIIRCEKICKENLKKHMLNNSNLPAENEKRIERKRPWEDDKEKISQFKKIKQTDRKLTKKLNPSDFDKEKSIFLSNMRSSVTEEKLKELFPNAVKILIPTDKRGNSRCFAYIEFGDKEEAEKSLQRDREPIDGRPLFISKCRSQEQTEKKFKFPTTKEKNKLFVKGLPFSYTNKDLEDIFKPHGAVAVRLVTYKDGQSKGLAYIEFSNEEMAEKALKATDQMKLEDSTISVFISAPPPKKSPSEERTLLGAGRNGSTLQHGRPRLKVPLIPRALQSKVISSNSTETSENKATAKSNEDFRKMLLKKS
ncbi:squamous cell carcinoma antigen recognized by T-cells 3 isoform X2 [Agrilus planipennis]|uniref:Squamous cell carcinoma antigen recognized by T-cells 3 isoform X2 n=1 Tax=Agrilus planipennis TaxID=224129 RepID=A0A7F5R1U7_AGRPL|nr:squamous cell carcinoma antigen recognized by T-cells 3 isoform X2 [Agrilus planipennis]